MGEAFANQVSVESPTLAQGLRVDHPRLKAYIRKCIQLGWGNEQIVRTIVNDEGGPTLVSKVRHQYEKERREKK